jgi:DNA-binding transcriptional ArsR family regulator
MFLLIHSDKSLSLSQISEIIELPANLVFYHLKKLKEEYLVLEDKNKRYTCQPILRDEESEDLEALILVIIRLLAKELKVEKKTEKTLSKAVLENLKMYLQIFEFEVE